ncbi:MAG: DUF5131 family protein [Acidimicrobiaceae bacterium]|nr:DUF5131 family protein [Acidimicrobiaceae bacterium]
MTHPTGCCFEESDLFHPELPLELIQRVFSVMSDTLRHTSYQVLTKRSKRLTVFAKQWRR